MRRSKFPVISIVLYVFATLFAAYMIWAAIYAFNTISEAVAAGQLVISGSEFEVANFLMNSVAQYTFFAIVLFALGRIVQVVSSDVDNDEDEAPSFEEIADEDANEDAPEDVEPSNEG